MFKRIFTVLALATLVSPAVAHEEPAGEDTSPWFGAARLGYLATSGNTDNSTLNSSFDIGYTEGLWTHLLSAVAIQSAETNQTTAEAYALGWKTERKINDTDYLFGLLDWRKDRFSSYDSQFSQTVGYGRQLINREPHTLNAELGIGARQSKLINGLSQNELILRGGAYYRLAISETTEFRQDFTVEAGDENTYGESVTALAAKLLGDLALVASYTIKHNTDVLPLLDKTDTYTALSLEYVW